MINLYNTITKKDYEILKEVYNQSPTLIKDKLINLSCWKLFDVAHLEKNIINIGVIDGIPVCLYNLKKKHFTLHNRLAQAGDIVCMTSSGQATNIPKEYIGRYYVCSGVRSYTGEEMAYLNAYDTYLNNGDTYDILLPQDCYLVVEVHE